MTAAEPQEVRHDVGDAPRPDAAPPGVAAFDFDGTLTRGGSVWQFLSSLTGRWAVVRAGIVLAPRLVLAALFGGRWADKAKEALFLRTVRGLSAAEVNRRAADFGRAHYERRGRINVRARVDWHRRQGHVLVLVSASPECYVRPVGEDLGFDAVLATRLAVDDHGRLTGRFAGRNCRGREKLLRLEQWIDGAISTVETGANGQSGRRPFVWAYGNSAGDRRLLQAADIGVDAGRLGRVGALRRFRRLGDVLTSW
jgi:phosphatidylglycerophosphatase C